MFLNSKTYLCMGQLRGAHSEVYHPEYFSSPVSHPFQLLSWYVLSFARPQHKFTAKPTPTHPFPAPRAPTDIASFPPSMLAISRRRPLV